MVISSMQRIILSIAAVALTLAVAVAQQPAAGTFSRACTLAASRIVVLDWIALTPSLSCS